MPKDFERPTPAPTEPTEQDSIGRATLQYELLRLERQRWWWRAAALSFALTTGGLALFTLHTIIAPPPCPVCLPPLPPAAGGGVQALSERRPSTPPRAKPTRLAQSPPLHPPSSTTSKEAIGLPVRAAPSAKGAPSTPPPCPKITPHNFTALPPSQRSCLREQLMVQGRLKTVRAYRGLRLHHLFGEEVVYVNGKMCRYQPKRRNHSCLGRKGWRTVRLKEGMRLSYVGPRDALGFSTSDLITIRSYYRFHVTFRDDNVYNRTFAGRFVDHQLLLDGLLRNPSTPELKTLHTQLFPYATKGLLFFDIGPGIANIDLYEGAGEGVPAVTSLELAKQFPTLPVVLLDLPNQVAIFMGKRKGRTKKGERYTISPEKRQLLLAQQNIHLIAGNGLHSLKVQFFNQKRNPLPRPRPPLTTTTTIVIRAVNSIDIYCKYHKRNGRYPSLREAFEQLSSDFKPNPVLFFFNRSILFKASGERRWLIIGTVSSMGFDHNERTLKRGKEPPYTFNRAFYHYLMKGAAPSS